MEAKTRVELLKSIYEQHWLHARHLEYERTWLLVAYAGSSIAAAVAFQYLRSEWLPAGIMFFILVTVIALLLTIRWSISFEEHRERVRTIIEYIGLKTIVDSKGKTVDLTMDISANWFWKIFRTRRLFYYLYGGILAILIILLVMSLKSPELLRPPQ